MKGKELDPDVSRTRLSGLWDRERRTVKHPSEETILADALARAEGREGDAAFALHRASCPACAARDAEIGGILEALAHDRTPEPPVLWVERAIQAFPRDGQGERLRAWGRGLREEIARLVFDSFDPGDAALAGVRQIGSGRRVRFESQELELDLQIESEGRGAKLIGQVLRLVPDVEPLAGARLFVSAGTRDGFETTTDDLGEFSIEGAGAAPMTVRVAAGERIVLFRVPDAPNVGE